jgi:hypothetical protein
MKRRRKGAGCDGPATESIGLQGTEGRGARLRRSMNRPTNSHTQRLWSQLQWRRQRVPPSKPHFSSELQDGKGDGGNAKGSSYDLSSYTICPPLATNRNCHMAFSRPSTFGNHRRKPALSESSGHAGILQPNIPFVGAVVSRPSVPRLPTGDLGPEWWMLALSWRSN